MRLSIPTIATISTALAPVVAASTPGNVTFSATFKDGSSHAIAALHEGAGFSFFFTYDDQEIYYDFDWQTGIVYLPLESYGGGDPYTMVMDIDSGFTTSDSSDDLHPMTLSITNESSVFWYLDRPTGGSNKLHGILKSESAPVKFYAGKNYTDPYQYSKTNYFIAGSVVDFDYLDIGDATDVQEVEIWATVVQE